MTWLLANTMTAGVLCLVVLAAGRWLRPAPAVMHGLWLVVLLKLATPPLFEVPIDVSWWSPAVGPAPELMVEPAAPELFEPPADSPGRESALANAAAVASEAKGPSLWLWSWPLGSLLFVLLFLVGVWRDHCRRRGFVAVSPELQREVGRLASRMRVRAPKLREDPNAAAPYIWSFGRVVLMLPSARLIRCSTKGRAAVLAHELAHLRRRDHWIARGELVLAALLWWHPLFWFARSRMRLWAELSCDAIAIATVPGATLDYATVLIDAAARPDSAVPGLAVLASRPAARAAFERRLLMILSDKLPRRASPIWCVPFAALALGLFAMPVVAQKERASEDVRIEVRVNGKTVDELSPQDKKALLKLLLQQEQVPAPKVKTKAKPRAEPRRADSQKPKPSRLHGLLGMGLAEARRQIEDNDELYELGITDEVLELIDGLAAGDGLESSLDSVVRAAMKGAGKIVVKEIRNDSDLRELGIADGIEQLVTGFLSNERNQDLVGELARQALGTAIVEVKREIRSDSDLQELGIAVDVEKLIDGVISGGDIEGSLERVIEKAVQGALQQVEREVGAESGKGEPKVERRRVRRVIR